MAQAALRIETETAPVSEFAAKSAIYAQAFAAFETLADAAKVAKAGNATSAKALRVSERALMWAAFDVAMLADAPGDDLAERFVSIAARKGVDEKNFHVYRLRAKDAAGDAAPLMAKADRDKVSPFTVAKNWREGAEERKARIEAEAAHIEGAEADAAEDLKVTPPMFRAMLRNGDPLAQAAYSAALNERMGRASIVAEAYAFKARLADLDPATLAAIGAVFAGLA